MKQIINLRLSDLHRASSSAASAITDNTRIIYFLIIRGAGDLNDSLLDCVRDQGNCLIGANNYSIAYFNAVMNKNLEAFYRLYPYIKIKDYTKHLIMTAV